VSGRASDERGLGVRRRGPRLRAFLPALAMLGAVLPGVAHATEPIEIRGMTFVLDEASGRHLVVRAERARVDPVTEVAQLAEVEVLVRGERSGMGLTLRCTTARITLGDQAFRLDGDVVGVDGDGRRMRTEWLEYDPAAQTLRTTAPVTVVDGAAEYRGQALVYEVDARRLRLLGGVSVVRGAP
jgi:LPS export ABC transporter protein LptC